LLRKAADAGATIREATAFERIETRADGIAVTTSRGVLKARYLVGADGVFSQVRHAIFGRGVVTYAPAVEALVSVTPEHHERLGNRVLFDFGGMPHGYGWIFPKEDHLNVGVYSIYPTRSIKTALARFMSRYEILQTPLRVRFQGLRSPSRTGNNGSRGERSARQRRGRLRGIVPGRRNLLRAQSATIATDALWHLRWLAEPRLQAADRGSPAAGPDVCRAQCPAVLSLSAGRVPGDGEERTRKRLLREMIWSSRPRECFYKALLTWPCCLWSRRLAPLAAPLL
jgi:hypothetical protein